jgi:hypothetical protein
MRKCPKCSRQYDDSSRICRTCGSFLEVVAESSTDERADPEASPEVDESPLVLTPVSDKPEEIRETLEAPPADGNRPLWSEQSWTCPQCHKPVPRTFDVCWNCGTSRDGTLDPNFVREPVDIPSDAPDDESTIEETAPRHGLLCSKCGSSKIIPKARVIDQGRNSDGHLEVVIYGKPDALLFKDRCYGRLTADICGECGHVELRVENPEELYDHYRRTAK